MKRVSVLLSNDKVYEKCIIRGPLDTLIGSISLRSGSCCEGSAFVALKGIHTDGHRYIPQAIGKGARLIIHSEEIAEYLPHITYLRSDTPALAASTLAYRLYEPFPGHLIGITGTDGKSTTAVFLYRMLKGAGKRTGILSTVALDDGSGYVPSPYRQSTPEPEILYPFLSRCAGNGVEYVILETTSHALSHRTGRLYPLRFTAALVQSISREHLDFHTDMEQYVDDKMNLIRQTREEGFVIASSANPYLMAIRAAGKERARVLTYGVDERTETDELSLTTVRCDTFSRTLDVSYGNETCTFTTVFPPLFFAENIAAALVAAVKLTSLPVTSLIREDLLNEEIKGRYQMIRLDADRLVIIDFAHTPDAFEKLLSGLKETSPKRSLSVLFGAAGRRDSGKRSPLGKAAGTYCARIYLTEEDSRDEDLSAIWKEITRGVRESGFEGELFTFPSRPEAIRRALRDLKEGGILLLLGKGHEQSIETKEGKHPYDEEKTLRRILAGDTEI